MVPGRARQVAVNDGQYFFESLRIDSTFRRPLVGGKWRAVSSRKASPGRKLSRDRRRDGSGVSSGRAAELGVTPLESVGSRLEQRVSWGKFCAIATSRASRCQSNPIWSTTGALSGKHSAGGNQECWRDTPCRSSELPMTARRCGSLARSSISCRRWRRWWMNRDQSILTRPVRRCHSRRSRNKGAGSWSAGPLLLVILLLILIVSSSN